MGNHEMIKDILKVASGAPIKERILSEIEEVFHSILFKTLTLYGVLLIWAREKSKHFIPVGQNLSVRGAAKDALVIWPIAHKVFIRSADQRKCQAPDQHRVTMRGHGM